MAIRLGRGPFYFGPGSHVIRPLNQHGLFGGREKGTLSSFGTQAPGFWLVAPSLQVEVYRDYRDLAPQPESSCSGT